MGGVSALGVLLGLLQLLMGLILLSPVASLAGFASGRPLASLSAPAAVMILAFTAPSLWLLALAVFSFRGLTPWAAAALQAAARSAERGGGLLGAFGLIPITLCVALGGLALASLWLLRAVRRAPSGYRSR